jgi:hypothetical protein
VAREQSSPVLKRAKNVLLILSHPNSLSVTKCQSSIIIDINERLSAGSERFPLPRLLENHNVI